MTVFRLEPDSPKAPGAAQERALPTPELVSPELALVCPELAARARALLPDRPWEAFLPADSPTAWPGVAPPEAPRDLRAAVRPAPRSGRTRAAVDLARMPPRRRIPAAVPAPAVPAPGRRGQVGRHARRALALAVGVALLGGALVWASDQTPQAILLPPEPSAPAQAPPTSPAPTGAATEPGARVAPPRPAPAGGYLFPGGQLVADRAGRAVTLRLVRGCGAGVTTPPLPVADGRFRYTARTVAGAPLVVAGRVSSEDLVVLRVKLGGRTPCTRVERARLS